MRKNEKTKKYEVVKFEDDKDVQDTKVKINEVNNLLIKLKEILKEDDKKILINNLSDLKRIEEEMTKGLYFVTIQGSLKTGKSTLTNLLAGEEVAVTKSGSDTTKVPYVITKSKDDEARIVVYRLNDNTGFLEENNENHEIEVDNQIKEIIKSIIDDIKGLDIVKTKKFSKNKVPFDLKNVEKYTVEPNTDNVILINIQIPKPNLKQEDWILEHDIAILDTPGIEGEKASQSQKEISEIQKRTDMLIVMQSTVTPINKVEIEELDRYRNKNVSSVRLLHNQFELKSWWTKEDKIKFKENEKESIDNALKKLKPKFGVVPFRTCNLVKVSDYLKGSYIDTKKADLESEYDEFLLFEKEMINKINEKRVSEKKKKAKKDLKKFIDNILKSNEENSLNKIIEKYESFLENLDDEKASIEEKFKKFNDQLEKIPDNIIMNNYYEMENKIFNTLNNINIKIDLNKFIDNEVIAKTGFFNTDNYSISEKTINEIKEFINDIQVQLNKFINKEFLNIFQEQLDNQLSENLEKINNLTKKYNVGKILLPHLDSNIFQEIVFDVRNDEIKNCIEVVTNYDEIWIVKTGAEYIIKPLATQDNLIKILDKQLKQQKDLFISSLRQRLIYFLNILKSKLELTEKNIEDKIRINNEKSIKQAESVVELYAYIEAKLQDLKNTL
jgi:nicotinamide riboside kinase